MDINEGAVKAYQQLLTAKENVKWLLNNPEGLVEMKGLTYWAERVEQLREEVKA